MSKVSPHASRWSSQTADHPMTRAERSERTRELLNAPTARAVNESGKSSWTKWC
jgi:hypothetical protein